MIDAGKIRAAMLRCAKISAAASGVGVVALSVWMMRPIPAAMIAPPRTAGVVIEDRHGAVLRTTRSADGSRERWIGYDRIDPDLINAFVAVEDRRFWEHPGIDVRAVARAIRENFLEHHVVSGASTITMQLARIVRPASRTWHGKLLQALWALRIERHLTKQQILEQYLNRVQLGQATIGVGAASEAYFDASAENVSIAQAATLAGIAHAPSRDNPLTSAHRARVRRTHALERMRAVGYATREDVAHAGDEPIRVAPRSQPFVAPHFTTRVLSWVGAANSETAAAVRTSIDAQLQADVEAEVGYTVHALTTRGVEDAAAVVLDNRTGGVLAWVGSPDFWSAGDGQTDMVVSARQPGSALKPFLYGLALDRGFTAATILPDIAKSYPAAIGSYSPRNYDRRFRGPVRAREALASSYNVPAVELASRVGTGSLLHTLRLAGFGSLRRDAEEYGLGLALGNGDVTLLELANGYRALANDGVWTPWTWRATASRTGEASNSNGRRVFSTAASAIVLDMLGDASARIPGFGISTPFDFPFPVAVKTGTSRHFTDNWAVATTRGFTVAVWAGNFNGRPMQGVSGVTGAGPLLHRVVMDVAKYVSPGALTTPAEAGAVSAPVCRLSGMLATPRCAQLTEWFVAGTQPTEPDDWERADGVKLPAEYAAWSGQEMRSVAVGTSLASSSRAETSVGTVVREASESSPRTEARFRIVSPQDGDRYAIPPGVEARYATLSLRAAGVGADRVRWLVDGASHDGARWPLREGTHVIKAVSPRGESAESTITVER